MTDLDLHVLLDDAGADLASASVAPPAAAVLRRGARRRRLRRASAITASVLAVTAVGLGVPSQLDRPEPVGPAQVSSGPVEIEIALSRTTVRSALGDQPGDPVYVTVTITNTTERPLELTQYQDSARNRYAHSDPGKREDLARVVVAAHEPPPADRGREWPGALGELKKQWLGEAPRAQGLAAGHDESPAVPAAGSATPVSQLGFQGWLEPDASMTREFTWWPQLEDPFGDRAAVAVAVATGGQAGVTYDPFGPRPQSLHSMGTPQQVSEELAVEAPFDGVSMVEAADLALADPQFAAWVQALPRDRWNGSRLWVWDGQWRAMLDDKATPLGLPDGSVYLDVRSGAVVERRTVTPTP